jgi:hypothetical protein
MITVPISMTAGRSSRVRRRAGPGTLRALFHTAHDGARFALLARFVQVSPSRSKDGVRRHDEESSRSGQKAKDGTTIARDIPSILGRAMGKLLGPATAGLVLHQITRSSADSTVQQRVPRLEPKSASPVACKVSALELSPYGAWVRRGRRVINTRFALVSIRQSRGAGISGFRSSWRCQRIPTLPVRRTRRDDQERTHKDEAAEPALYRTKRGLNHRPL